MFSNEKHCFQFLTMRKKKGNVATVSNDKNYLLFAEEQEFGICQTFAFLQM